MKIRSVAVLGAGAVGSYIIWGLSKLEDIKFGVIAEGERAERLQKKGCTINDITYYPQVWNPKEAHGVDLLIVSLKYGALEHALDNIKEIVAENTMVMSLMNGVDSEEIMGKCICEDNILYSLIKIASHRKENGVYFNPKTTVGIVYGETKEPFESKRVLALEELLSRTEIHYRRTDMIREEIWAKFRLNVCNNLPQAILGAGVGCYRDSKHMQAINEGLRNELEKVAFSKEIDLSKCPDSIGHGSPVKTTAKFSTLQDLEAGRHTEIDMFSGALIKMGREQGIPTPYNEYTYHMIKAIEEKNDGLFDYTGNEPHTWAK